MVTSFFFMGTVKALDHMYHWEDKKLYNYHAIKLSFATVDEIKVCVCTSEKERDAWSFVAHSYVRRIS